MAWKINDEWIDLGAARHVVVFHNPDVLVGKQPVEHHLHHEFKLDACPHCGHATKDKQGISVDFALTRQEVHDALNGHHQLMMQYREKHPHVRLGSGPRG